MAVEQVVVQVAVPQVALMEKVKQVIQAEKAVTPDHSHTQVLVEVAEEPP